MGEIMSEDIEKMPDRCTVEKCGNEKQRGDLLFCFLHREKWIELCKGVGIHEKLVDKSIIEEYLNKFQNRMI